MVNWEGTGLSCHYNHGPAVRLFFYRSSLQEVFLQKEKIKKI